MKKTTQTRGVTLVEILIAVIIIVVLSGIMLIGTDSADEKAKKTACAANKRAITAAYSVRRSVISMDLQGFINSEYYNTVDNSQKTCPSYGLYLASGDNIICSFHDKSKR